LIALLSLLIGFPLVLILKKVHLGRWWSCTLGATAIGAALPAVLTYHPMLNGDEIQNPFSLVFSPFTRDRPGFVETIPFSSIDYLGSISFGAIVGGALGIAFWHFYSRGTSPN
jgi:hypothetical protein